MNVNAANFDPSQSSQGYPPPSAEGVGNAPPHGAAAPYYAPNTGEGVFHDPGSGHLDHTGAEGMGYADYSHQDSAQYSAPHPYEDPALSSHPAGWNQPEAPPVPPGYYYPTAHLAPQLYGAPISALAYDDEHEAIYVASHTQPSSDSRKARRASMLVTHSTVDGMRYSSCAGHPEATTSALLSVYDTFYGSGAPGSKLHVPPHAYRPPYGDKDIMVGEQTYQMGITALLPSKGYVASVSPSAVRLHSHGGLCVSDQNIEGMVCGTFHPSRDRGMTHISVGGVALGSYKSHVHCMDLYQGLRIVSSNSFRSESSSSIPMGVMCLATNYHKQTLVAGCSDGTIRLLDGSWRKRGGSELAKIKSHGGGVTDIDVSQDGNLICTLGFGSRPSKTWSNTPFGYPDPHLLLYDVRYLGRGSFVQSFSGIRGGPRFLSFLPDMEGQAHSRVMVASGQRNGGMQIVTPFESENINPASFVVPQLGRTESITSMYLAEERLAIGTSHCNVLQYELEGFDKSKAYHKQPLVVPNYTPEVPALSIDPMVLQSSGGALRNGANDKMKSIFTSYVLCSDPSLSTATPSSFGRLSQSNLLPSSKRNISGTLSNVAVGEDFLATVPVAKLGISLLGNHDETSRREQKEKQELLSNPNKLLYAKKISQMCYENDANQKKWSRGRQRHETNRASGDNAGDEDPDGIPHRYRRTLRPSYIVGPHFDHAKYNDTGLWAGWDYSMAMPNSYVVGVLVLLYFEPEVRSAMLARQFETKLLTGGDKAPSLSMELGFLFHQMECLSRYAHMYPGESLESRMGAMTPVNFITLFASMPEAEALALLDGAPAAVDTARRPEAFYRFLLHHLDKELPGKKSDTKLMDSLHGLDFISVNEFITGSGPPTVSVNRSLTVDLAYAPFVKDSGVTFGEVLRHALCRETRLRAWCKPTKSYETIVQRKIATSLPQLLSLSCACAGMKEEEGLSVWRTDVPDDGHWLPEMVEVELEDDGNVLVRELKESAASGEPSWTTVKGKGKIPKQISKLVADQQRSTKKQRYRLEAVLSFVRDDMDPNLGEQHVADESKDDTMGHHVLHVREPSGYRSRALLCQRREVDELASDMKGDQHGEWTLTSKTKVDVLRKRSELLSASFDSLSGNMNDADDSWVMFNGFVVSKTVIEDARAFHVPFKEPCLVLFRAIEDESQANRKKKKNDDNTFERTIIPFSVMQTNSISTGDSPYARLNPSDFPGKGDLIAFDAEFVSVQEEESILTDTGSKVAIRETRHALARVSVIDCRTGAVLMDDHVLPREPVVDYLTRFSGIVEGDLDPKTSPHHLISTRSAYLKLRYLQERGCIFVGHGLSQDFSTANLVVPPNQIIDTVEIFHKDRMRYVSLRFLTNFVLKRDMQTEVHDSVEDARAAYELYRKAREFQANETFDSLLSELYEYGQKTDWKLGVDGDLENKLEPL